MPRQSRSRSNLSEEEKKKRRREQKKLSIRRARAKMNEDALEERRKKDRERYKKKKEQGLIKKIKDYTPREQRHIRKMWREKAKKKREKEKEKIKTLNFIEENTPPSSPSCSRVNVGRAVATRNRQKIVTENNYLKRRIMMLESKMAKYRMRLNRARKEKVEKGKQSSNTTRKSTKIQDIRKAIYDFLLQDENSRLTPGKKDTITRKKIKKQIRFLNDSLLNLHKKFVNTTGISISYETFRKNRPFWVLFPKVDSRNTCLCAIHTNFNFIIRALYNTKTIPYISASALVKSLCCNTGLTLCCLERHCAECKDKKIQYNDLIDNDTISYERWVTKTVTVVIKGQAKQCKRTVKEKVMTTKKNLLGILHSNLPTYMKHVAYIMHQLNAVQTIKQRLTPEDGLLHIDFSENYMCKYGQEIQSAHFGGSKIQLSLHTAVYYWTQSEPPNNYTEKTSFCTVSENVRHDPVLICVHLEALISKIKELSPKLKNLHVLSDGPSTQYRNKSMFHLIATYLSKKFGVNSITWHYNERGHGKGAPDGVGGCIKRICDGCVARGRDVASLDELMLCLHKSCRGIEVYRINESLIPEIDQLLESGATKPFKGTLGIHQLSWSIEAPDIIHARRLSCLECTANEICNHYETGLIQIKSKDPIVADLSRSNTPNSPVAPATPDASTEPNSPRLSDRLTPDNIIMQQICRPTKRKFRFYSHETDENDEGDAHSMKKIHNMFSSDDEDIF